MAELITKEDIELAHQLNVSIDVVTAFRQAENVSFRTLMEIGIRPYECAKDILLILASQQGLNKLVKALLDDGADVHARMYNPILQVCTPLQMAGDANHVEIVRLLIDAGADVHEGDDLLLWKASYRGNVELVQLLISAGADVHAKKDRALRDAVLYGHIKIAQLLINAGADIHIEDDYLLWWASEKGRTKTVRMLTAAIS